ncbi:TPA: hypothetical protein ACW96C_004542 [Yersinia enterocolitica]|nr:hypothetical protein [Yersinia enterocolitica]HDL6753068.1 hypothetical protein [Yersinia enterocolitica]HDL7879563.1 hypothetical protein [Yersinia enterocolitica]HDL7892081.1 hypothetical protein [Yersinia enterocolitica]HDM8317567.1 hypothetical protein [Yersinia enterocolitica]
MLSENQKFQINMSMNDNWHLVKLTQVWPDGHLINQMAHALLESNAELLSLREQLAELKAWATNRAITDDARENENYTTLKIDYRQRQLRELLKAAKPAEE